MDQLGPSEKPVWTYERPLRERALSAGFAAMAYWFYRWDWGEAIALDGLDAAATAFTCPALSDYVSAGVEAWITETGMGSPSRHGPARSVLRRRGPGADDRYLRFARRIGDGILSLPQHRKGPVLLDPTREAVFVDSHYGEPAFLAELSNATNDERYAAFAVTIALHHSRTLQDESSGLYRHFADLGTGQSPAIYWGRGNGWAALGLSDLLARLDSAMDGIAELRQRFRTLCDALAANEVPGGGWRNLVDIGSSYPEASTTAMVVAGMTQAVETGNLPPSFAPVAARGWASFAHQIDANGHLRGVSFRPGINTDPSRYEHTPAVGAYPWGQGPYLIAAAQRAKVESAGAKAGSDVVSCRSTERGRTP